MSTFRTSNMRIDWNDTELLERIGHGVDVASEHAAWECRERAIGHLAEHGAVDTGDLLDSIKVKVSRFPHGGYAVSAQASGDYKILQNKDGSVRRRFYSSFVELGGHYSLWGKYTVKKGNSKAGPYFHPRPYLRPAIKAIKRKFPGMIRAELIGGGVLKP